MTTDDRRGRGRRGKHVSDDATTHTTNASGDDEASEREGGAAMIEEPGTDTPDTPDTAAASALARAREAARSKGLRPGSRPLRKRRTQGQQGSGLPGSAGSGRDPAVLGDQMDRLLLDRGWNLDVAVGAVMGRWPEIVGPDVAEHCKPVTFSDGVLTVRADSTAWTTQMRLMSSSILGRLESEVGKDAVTELRVQGPSAPSWSRGPRKSTGPGPRDTYG
ncbi:MAG: DciA family protein [Actinomycetota bacterium]